jgi:peptidyl-prolyl cis-trans isomerase C
MNCTIARATLALGMAAVLGACSGDKTPPSPSTPPTTHSEADLAKPLPSPLPDVAARVNGQAVPMRNVALAARQLGGGEVPDDKRPTLLRQGMYKLIVRELLFQEAVARKVPTDEKGMEQAYNEARIPYKDDAAWTAFLTEQGMDGETLRTELRIQYTVKALIEQEALKAALPISDVEAKAFYEANPMMFESGERLKAAHILVRVPSGMPADRKGELLTRVQGILVRARKGEDFSKLAKQYSEDVGSKDKRGELQVFGRGQMKKQFEDAAYALEPGQVSDVVETPFGYHIIKLHERLPTRKLLYEQVVPKVKGYLQEQKRAANLEQLVSGLRTKARIETFI